MMKIVRGTKLYSIMLWKCPRCHKGNLFLNNNPYNLKMLDKMPDCCPVCKLDFVREVGFYYGAMMISHALTTVIAVIVHLTVFHYYAWEIAPHLIYLISIILVLFPVVFRTARTIWINLFVKYKPEL
ncbi:MAG: DUF983 domain-containing protein [Bacteroidia bacterium]|nr:DUF983 domain-containing protein [Bacteroidia bacterium]